jgi:CRISPR-associated endonuclease/helicase Cas3
VWLIALATNPDKVPRRLVYVVNRRTVVDQTTNEVESCRRNLANCPAVHDALVSLRAIHLETPDGKKEPPLAISTLRGQFADNREWSAEPH